MLLPLSLTCSRFIRAVAGKKTSFFKGWTTIPCLDAHVMCTRASAGQYLCFHFLTNTNETIYKHSCTSFWGAYVFISLGKMRRGVELLGSGVTLCLVILSLSLILSIPLGWSGITAILICLSLMSSWAFFHEFIGYLDLYTTEPNDEMSAIQRKTSRMSPKE